MIENNGIIVGTLRQVLNALDARYQVRVFEQTNGGSEMRMSGTVMHILECKDIAHLWNKYADRSVIAFWFYANDVTIMLDNGGA